MAYFMQLTELSNLYRLWFKVRQSRSLRPRFVKFNARLLEYLTVIQYRLREHQFEFGPYEFFFIKEKKMRSIANAPLKDRVVHWLLYEHLINAWMRRFIAHSFGNLPGRGTHAAVKQLAEWSRKPVLTHALQMDIAKYFSSVQHDYLKKILLEREGDHAIRQLLSDVIDSFTSGNEFDHLFDEQSPYRQTLAKGMPLGNLTSQIFANIYLNEFDHWVKETLRHRYYIRYVDDLVFLGESSAQIVEMQTLVIEKLHTLGLTVNPRKIAIRRIDKGIPFLGYIVWKNHVSAGKFLRNRYNRFLRRSKGQHTGASLASYKGILKHTGATR